jgi:hypothetical protein
MRAVAYDWAVLRAVPRVHVGMFVNVAVILHARTAGFLELRALTDPAELARRVPSVDPDLLLRYLQSVGALCRGETVPQAGHAAVALAPPSERFHWLTAPRSDVLQTSPVHGGSTEDLPATLDRLYAEQVLGHGRPA